MYVQICKSVYLHVKAKGCCCCLSVSLCSAIFKNIFQFFIHRYVCVCVGVHGSVFCHKQVESRGAWKRALDPLELMFQVAVSHPAQVRGVKLYFSGKAASMLNYWTISIPYCCYYYYYYYFLLR